MESSSRLSICKERDGSDYQKADEFSENFRGRGVIFNQSKKIILQTLDLYIGLLWTFSEKNVQNSFPTGEISSERDGTKKMMKNLNIIQISHLTFECS